jgi:hypothetical protein
MSIRASPGRSEGEIARQLARARKCVFDGLEMGPKLQEQENQHAKSNETRLELWKQNLGKQVPTANQT